MKRNRFLAFRGKKLSNETEKIRFLTLQPASDTCKMGLLLQFMNKEQIKTQTIKYTKNKNHIHNVFQQG